MAKTVKRIKNFFKILLSGLIGAGIFFMFSIIAFAIAKIVFILMKQDLIISRYNIMAVILIFVIVGFAYGLSSYIRKDRYKKMMTPGWKNITIDVIISLVFAIIAYVVLKQRYYMLLTTKSTLLLFLLFLIVFFAFAALLVQLTKRPKDHKHKKRNLTLAIILNPLFVIVFLGLFAAVIYNSLYIPCGVTIVGIDKNSYTSNTQKLGINGGEKVLTIDNVAVSSLQDVKRYISSIKSTKQVSVETENNIYYIQTYQVDNVRYMGLLLKQEYCPAK